MPLDSARTRTYRGGMRFALAAALLLAACSDDGGVDPELPAGSWRTGSWTCTSGCGAAPTLTTATWVEVSDTTMRWMNTAGGVVEMDTVSADGLCWNVPATADHGAFDLCGDLCDGEQCARAESVAIGSQSWQFVATR